MHDLTAISVKYFFSVKINQALIKHRNLTLKFAHCAYLFEILLCKSDTKLLIVTFSVGPLYVDISVPKMEDVEKWMSSEFNGWVDKGGRWKPTDCKARVKVRCELFFK